MNLPASGSSPASGLGADALILVDGLIAARAEPALIRAFKGAGLTSATVTCAIWEGMADAIANLARWHHWFAKYSEDILPVYSTSDFYHAGASRRTGVLLAFQNTSPLEDQIGYLRLYKRLGVGIMQLTYNTQNLVGTGCYERSDGGLSDFGRDVVREMNACGIAVDLSHVGHRTSDDAILHSREPVAFSHIVPAAKYQHPRNKQTEQIVAVARNGGLVGITTFPSFLPKGARSTLDDYLSVVEWAIDTCGEDHVGYSSDSTQGQGPSFFEWITRDKGYGRRLVRLAATKPLRGLRRLQETPHLVSAMRRRGWKPTTIRKVLGLNWIRFYKRVWHEPVP